MELTSEKLCLRVDGVGAGASRVGVGVEVAAVRRGGEQHAPIVLLHGFGSTKEDYADLAYRPELAGRPFLAYGAPGCGRSACDDLAGMSIPFLVNTGRAVLESLGIRRFHLVGHSMGGLTGLLLAHEEPGRVLSFVDIEGDLAPEDCFLSRQILTQATDDPETFLADLTQRARQARSLASALYTSSLRHKVRSGAVRGIFESMVEPSDHRDLMKKFLSLPFPRMFMYGEQNASLSCLGELNSGGVELAEISHRGHWPMYSNPVTMWERIADFHARIS